MMFPDWSEENKHKHKVFFSVSQLNLFAGLVAAVLKVYSTRMRLFVEMPYIFKD